MTYFMAPFVRALIRACLSSAIIRSASFTTVLAVAAVYPIDYTGTNLGGIADGGNAPACGAARDVQFNVTGFSGNIGSASVRFTMNPQHTYIGDLIVTLIAPNNTSHVLFGRPGVNSVNDVGDSSNMSGTFTFNDLATGNIWAAAAAVGDNASITPGSYRTQLSGPFGNDNPGPALTNMNATLVTVPAASVNGTWRLRFQDCAAQDTGSVSAATLTLIPFAAGPATISGRVVTAAGAGVRKVLVQVHGGNLEAPLAAMTGPSGSYKFEGLEAGQTYIVTVRAKRFHFEQPTMLVNLDQNIADFNFIALR